MEKSFNCEICNYQAKYKYEYTKHLNSAKHKRGGKSLNYNCDKCDYMGLNKWNLTMHQAKNHYSIDEKKTMRFYCAICDCICFSQLYYNTHINSTLHKSKILIHNFTKDNNITIPPIIKNENKTNMVKLEENLKLYIKDTIDNLKNDLLSDISMLINK
jgi:hypothetical protein